MNIDFHDQTKEVPADIISTIQRILLFAAQKEGIAREAEISVNFMDDAGIRALNRNYRQFDESTDVLSFALHETTDEGMDMAEDDILPLALGDIVISVETAKRQAHEFGHSLKRELCFLSLHGFLHILGYDHMNETEEQLMFNRQNDYLELFGIDR